MLHVRVGRICCRIAYLVVIAQKNKTVFPVAIMVVAAIGNNLIYNVFGILGIMHRDASYSDVGNVGRNLVIAILVFLAALVVV